MKDQINTLHILTYFFQSLIDPVNSTHISYITGQKKYPAPRTFVIYHQTRFPNNQNFLKKRNKVMLQKNRVFSNRNF
jgi:hypothetical protein